MHEETSYISLLIVVALAAIVPLLTTQFRRVRVPVVVGEIIAGIIVGKSGLNLVSGEDPWLILLSALGFSYLMFLSGLELDFDMLSEQVIGVSGGWRALLKSPLGLAVASFLLTVIIALVFAIGLQSLGLAKDAILMALILSTTSLGLVVPILKERRELQTSYGQALLAGALVADFATMLAISIYVVLKVSGPTPRVLVVLLLLGVFFTVYRVLLRMKRHPPLEALFQRASAAAGHIQTRGAFAIALLFIALAQQLGIEVILGAFLGGALVSLISGGHESRLREQLDTLGYGFFIPIFFITVGVSFDLGALLDSRELLLLVPVLIAIAYAVKMVGAAVFRLSYGWRKTLGAGVLLSSRLSLIIAASAIALDLGAISPGLNAAIILLAVVTCTASPLLFNRIVPMPEETVANLVMVIGSDREALLLAERLTHHEDPVVLVLADGARPAGPMPAGVQPVPIESVDRESLRVAGLGRAKRVVALLDDDAANLRLCQVAHTAFRIPHVVARVKDPANVEAYAAVGAVPVTHLNAEITVLENLASNPSVFTLLSAPNGDQEVIELAVTNAACDGTPMHTLKLPGAALIMVIRRDESFVVPRGDTRLMLNDTLTVLASPAEADRVRIIFT